MLIGFLAWLSLASSVPPGVVIDHEPPPGGRYIGSPSIVILPKGDYLASHDFFGPGSTQSTSGLTRIFRSTDRGRTWRQLGEVSGQFWSNLFAHGGAVYLMGTTCEYGRVAIRRSTDGGNTWSPPAFLTAEPNYHTAPTPVVEKDGRLWRAMEYHPPGPWGFFEALVLSAPVKSDLLDPKHWTISARLPYPANAGQGRHWLEGNAVIGPDGSLLDILRVDNIEKAALVRVRNGTPEFQGLTEFPGGSKKFTIRYDGESRRYWTLSNPALKEYSLTASDPASVRNTLALMSSEDLRSWRLERSILSDLDPVHHGFHYVDWEFDGSDIVAVSRTAFDDDWGGPPRAHDANYFTFHRIAGFRPQ